MPDKTYVQWCFDGYVNVDEVVKNMCTCIKDYGVPFINSGASLEDIVVSLSNPRITGLEQSAYRLPVAYALLGQVDRALNILGDAGQKLGGRTDAAAQVFRAFAISLASLLRAGRLPLRLEPPDDK